MNTGKIPKQILCYQQNKQTLIGRRLKEGGV